MHALLEEESLYVANLPPEKASVRTAENPPWRSPFDRSGNVMLKASDGSGHGVPDLRSFGNIPMGTCSLAASEYRRDCETASFPNLDDSSDTQSSPGLNLTHSLHHFLSILRIWRTYFITMKFCRDAYLWQDWDTFLVQSGDCIDGGGGIWCEMERGACDVGHEDLAHQWEMGGIRDSYMGAICSRENLHILELLSCPETCDALQPAAA